MRSIYSEFIAFFIFLIHIVNGKKCYVGELLECPENETCEQIADSPVGICKCSSGFDRLEKICVNVTKPVRSVPSSTTVGDEGSSHIVAIIFVSLILIALVILSAYYSRKYRVVTWIRMKINQRNINYDEVMIGQDLDDDEPPLH